MDDEAGRSAVARVRTVAVPAKVAREKAAIAAARASSKREVISAEYIPATSISAVGSAERDSSPPTIKTKTLEDRAGDAVAELSLVSPGQGEAIVARLMKMGERAIPIMKKGFPGRMWFDRRSSESRLPRGRAASGLASAFYALGADALPHLRELMTRPGASARHCALLVYADLDAPDVCLWAAALALDDDKAVRDAALMTLRARYGSEDYEEAVENLRSWLGDSPPVDTMPTMMPGAGAEKRNPTQLRLHALRALGVLRDRETVPLAAALLDQDDRPGAGPLQDAAHRVLVTLTAHDLGQRKAPWQRWYRRHRNEARYQWMLAAARHRDLATRERARDELNKLLGEDCHFDPCRPWWARRKEARELKARIEASLSEPSPVDA